MATVSVLLPIYNAERYLAEAIESVINQTFSDWELILTDDGSSDKSKEIIDSFLSKDKRIKSFSNEANLGLISTLNKGITFCSGKYIGRMDADDIMMPDRLEKQVSFLEENPTYGMCGSNAFVIDQQGELKGKIVNITSSDLLKINLLFSVPFVHPSVLLRREVFDEFQYKPDYKHIEDYKLWVDVASRWDVANLPDFLLKYRWHDSNVSVVHQAEQNRLKQRIILEQLQTLDLHPDDIQIEAHSLTFNLYEKGKRKEVDVHNFHEVEDWFSQILFANKTKLVYNQDQLIAFLWARWIVLCLSQKQYFKTLPSFLRYNQGVFKPWVEIMKVLKQK